MTRMLALTALLAFIPFIIQAQNGKKPPQTVKIAGAPTVSLPLKDAADILKNDPEQSIILEISIEGGSSTWGISALGISDTDIAMSSRIITAEDRAQFPSVNFTEVYFGEETATLVVSNDVWESGVRMITKAQAKAIYEGKIRNWKELGGPDKPIAGYSAEQGREVWSCYLQWIYEDSNKTRPNRFAVVSTDDEAKSSLELTPGSITQVSMTYAESKNLHQLALKDTDGNLIQPNVATVAAHKYPMSRPLYLVVRNRPLGAVKAVVEFMLSDRGQALVHNHGYITLKELGVTPQTFE